MTPSFVDAAHWPFSSLRSPPRRRPPVRPPTATRRSSPAVRCRRSCLAGPPPAIDGRLDETAWATAAAAERFVESRPRPGSPAGLRSEALVLADAEALYVGLRYHDPAPATIVAPLVRRDDETTSDWAPSKSAAATTAARPFRSGSTRAACRSTAWRLSDTAYDFSWNAGRQAAAKARPTAGRPSSASPSSQLAFRLPEAAAELLWGINFYRYSSGPGASPPTGRRVMPASAASPRISTTCACRRRPGYAASRRPPTWRPAPTTTARPSATSCGPASTSRPGSARASP